MPVNVFGVVIYKVMIFLSFKLLVDQWARRKRSFKEISLRQTID